MTESPDMPPEELPKLGDMELLAEVDETLPSTITEARALNAEKLRDTTAELHEKYVNNGHLSILKNRIAQQVIIELTDKVSADLKPWKEMGVGNMAEYAAVKLGMDILSGQVQAKSAKDAAEAMKILVDLTREPESVADVAEKVRQSGGSVSATERTVVFREVKAKLSELRSEQAELPQPTIDVESEEA